MKETFCEVYLRIIASLLHGYGGKHAVDKVEQLPWSNSEHLMYNDHCHIGHTFTIRWMGMQQSIAGINKIEKC